MPTAHWVLNTFDTNYSGQETFPNLDIPVPAGATMKRFVCLGTKLDGRSSGPGIQFIQPVWLHMTVSIIAGQYFGSTLFRTTRSVKVEAVGLYDSATLERIYTGYYHAGDNEFGFNQRCSYGTGNGPGFTVRLASFLSIPAGGIVTQPTGRMVLGLRLLYLL